MPNVLIVRRVGVETWGLRLERVEVHLLEFVLEPIKVDVRLGFRGIILVTRLQVADLLLNGLLHYLLLLRRLRIIIVLCQL